MILADPGETARPGPLTPVFFRPMIHHVLDAAGAIAHRSLTLLVGRGEAEIRESCRAYAGLRFARSAEPLLRGERGDALILEGDRVLLSTLSLKMLLAAHAKSGAACTVARAGSAEPAAYCFRIEALLPALERIAARDGGRTRPAEAAEAIGASGGRTAEHRLADRAEGLRVSDPRGLCRVETILRERTNRALMAHGIYLRDPRTTTVDPRCRIDAGVVIEGGTLLVNSTVRAGATVESGCRVTDADVGEDCLIKQGCRLEECRLGRACKVGPYAYLRPGSHLGEEVEVGGFAEIKDASVGGGSRVGRLCYLGDAAVGRNVTVGSGFVTCDDLGSTSKGRTVIEDDVFIGSDSHAVAAVRLGAGSFIATGTTVTDDVPPDSFVISRGRQVTKPGYAKRYARPRGAASSS